MKVFTLTVFQYCFHLLSYIQAVLAKNGHSLVIFQNFSRRERGPGGGTHLKNIGQSETIIPMSFPLFILMKISLLFIISFNKIILNVSYYIIFFTRNILKFKELSLLLYVFKIFCENQKNVIKILKKCDVNFEKMWCKF